MFTFDVKFLTCDDTINIKNLDLKISKYETKKKIDHSVYDVGKRSYIERRGGLWRASNPRQIKKLEAKFRDRSVVFCEWTSDSLITIVYSSGAIAYLTVNSDTLDVKQILFDRYCVGKLSGQTVTGVLFSKTHLLFTNGDRMGTLFTFGKYGNTEPCRLADRDPHVQTIELGGGNRRAERRVSWSEFRGGLRALVWSASSAEPAPWSPVIEDLANLHLYTIQGQQISLTAYHQLENETLCAELSDNQDDTINIVEQTTCHKSGVTLEWLRYPAARASGAAGATRLAGGSPARAPLPAPARLARLAPPRVLVACIDGSLLVIHHAVGCTHSTKAGFIATDVRWAGSLLVAAEEGGRLQCFDSALSALHHHTKCLDLSTYFSEPKRMQLLTQRRVASGCLILASFFGGPLTLLRIIHPKLITAWLRSGRPSNAVTLLRAMDWDLEGHECLWAVNKIVCEALRKGAPDISSRESLAQDALGAYLAPLTPLGLSASKYAPAVHDLARKYFHHLLRRGRFEKALSLCVELRAADLSGDVRRAAPPALASEAAALARHYAGLSDESECSTSCSQCSSVSYSESEEETSASSEVVRTKPPPLPRVPVSPHPTILPVPITHTEPISTNSIRPNLHQYLERENTIWTTSIRDTVNLNRPITNKWHSMDNVLNQRAGEPKYIEVQKFNQYHIDLPRPQDKVFRHVYQAELREEPSTYRYQQSGMKQENEGPERPRNGEKNKVKFSDTVTIAVVPDSPQDEAARELAESLPLCPPHKYLAAFAPRSGTAQDFVQV